ncbi:hypothetical protein GCM10027056_20090 [Glaciibacter psychrotolerans]
MQVAPRSYRAWKKRPPAARTIDDAAVVDVLRGLRERDQKGPQKPEVLYGRRKMTAWLARQGFDGISKHTVDRLMRQEGMNGLVRGRRTRTTIPGKDGLRAVDLLNRDFSSPRPNHAWVTDFTYVPTSWIPAIVATPTTRSWDVGEEMYRTAEDCVHGDDRSWVLGSCRRYHGRGALTCKGSRHV